MKRILCYLAGILLIGLIPIVISCSKENSSKDLGKGRTAPKVFTPEELLSAEEATELSGFIVSIETTSLMKDTQKGIISERYKYDINESNTVHGLFQIEQNGFKPAAEISSGNTAKRSFETEMNFSKNEITALNDLGEQAFTFNNNGQLHMLYKDYYIISAFDADVYTNEKNAQLNINLGHRILANLKNKL